MTPPILPTTIRTPDGTYHREGMIGRILLRILMLIGILFLIAAVIGFGKAIMAPPAAPHTAPAKQTANYNDGWNDALRDIRDLAARPALHTATISDPNGIALLEECLSDSSLTLDEFHACIDQPRN